MVDLYTGIIVVAGLATASGAIVAGWYYVTRIGIEKKRSTEMQKFYVAQLAMMREQLQRTEVYYDQRIAFSKEQVEVEKAKLEVERAKLRQRQNDKPLTMCEHGKEFCGCRGNGNG